MNATTASVSDDPSTRSRMKMARRAVYLLLAAQLSLAAYFLGAYAIDKFGLDRTLVCGILTLGVFFCLLLLSYLRTREANSVQAEGAKGHAKGFLWPNILSWLRAMAIALAGTGSDASSNGHTDPKLQIEARRVELKQERAGLRLWRATLVVCSLAVPLIALWVVPKRAADDTNEIQWILGASLAFGEFYLLVILLFVRSRVANINAELKLLDYDFMLATLERSDERKAANLFFKHQAEVKQYYDQTLRQNRQSFVLGVFCVLSGLIAVVALAVLVLVNAAPPAMQVTIGLLGVVSALLTGFVARIYLQVYGKSSESLVSFHDRLVTTNHLHFANLLVSMISDTVATRDRTLSELVLAVASISQNGTATSTTAEK